MAARRSKEQSAKVASEPSLLVHSDTLDRDERRACLRSDAVVSAEDGERIPHSRIAARGSLAPTQRQCPSSHRPTSLSSIVGELTATSVRTVASLWRIRSADIDAYAVAVA
jgi:hypothetical protein